MAPSTEELRPGQKFSPAPQPLQDSNPAARPYAWLLASDDLVSAIGQAREATFRGGQFERGAALASSMRSTGGVTRSGPSAALDATTAHPLYGRYLGRWLEAHPDAPAEERFVQVLQDQMRQLKQVLRGTR
jgi:hypothetical protein